MSYCQSKLKAIVEYSFNGVKEVYTSDKPPIEIETISQNSVCWRFAGQGVGNDSLYEFFASGNSPSYAGVTEIGYTGNALFIDGNRLGGTGYMYRSGTQSISQVSDSVPTGGYSSFGSCNTGNCSIKITDNVGKIFQRSGNCPIKYLVQCDDDCPPGFCRCPIPEYPGYCCLDCNSTAASIRAITNELRAKNG